MTDKSTVEVSETLKGCTPARVLHDINARMNQLRRLQYRVQRNDVIKLYPDDILTMDDKQIEAFFNRMSFYDVESWTYDRLYRYAQANRVPGRKSMTKVELTAIVKDIIQRQQR